MFDRYEPKQKRKRQPSKYVAAKISFSSFHTLSPVNLNFKY